MNLAKTYDYLPHDLIITKLEACGLIEVSLKLLHDYFNKRYQRAKIGNKFSNFLEILIRVSQCSL